MMIAKDTAAWFVASSVLTLLQFTSPAQAASPALISNSDPVLYWNEVAMQNITGDPGLASRSYAMVNVALYSAINAAMGSPDKTYITGVSQKGGNANAAAAVAAHDVLVNLYPANAQSLNAALSASLSAIPNSTAKAVGISTGKAFAAATISLRSKDGFNNPYPPYTPTGQPGNYVPTSPPIPVVDGQFATATPFVIKSPGQFRAAPPPALTSAVYTAALNEVEAIGAVDSTVRTADQTFSAKFWENNPETPYLTAAIAESLATGKSLLDNARIFATLTTAVADAPIAAFDTKFTYDFWRPITAIQQADTDGNPLTTADPTWQPLLFTPPFPGYYSAHSIVAGTAASILDLEFGSSIGFCFDNDIGDRCWGSYDSAALDDSKSREWGGVHFSFDDQYGLSTGYELGQYAVGQNLFSPAPEPSSWAMMILGMAGIGIVARRRNRATPRLA